VQHHQIESGTLAVRVEHQEDGHSTLMLADQEPARWLLEVRSVVTNTACIKHFLHLSVRSCSEFLVGIRSPTLRIGREIEIIL